MQPRAADLRIEGSTVEVAPDSLTRLRAARSSLGLTAALPFALVFLREAAPRWLEVAMTGVAINGHVRARGETRAEISTGLVQLHRRFYGKGPTKAKTQILDDTVVCSLVGGFTTVERTLIETGERESVYRMRRSFQLVMEEEYKRVVEEASGRKVIAHMSAIHLDSDLAVELFVFEALPEQELMDSEFAGYGGG
jgi:uncharacterized protein YbcI